MRITKIMSKKDKIIQKINDDYTAISNDFLNDTTISLETKGFIMWLKITPEESIKNIHQLKNKLYLTDQDIRIITTELAENGYLDDSGEVKNV